MSTPMYDIPEHFPMPINADGQGPEMDAAKVTAIECWTCHGELWPCRAEREARKGTNA